MKSNQFSVSKSVFTALHSRVARKEALEWGVFRGEGQETHYSPDVSLGEYGRYTPYSTTPGGAGLDQLFSQGIEVLNSEVQSPFERALAFFLFGALQQFFFEGNKRTSRFMMNGILLSHGIDAMSVSAAKVQIFNEQMVQFYLSKNATQMMKFLVDCHPEVEKM